MKSSIHILLAAAAALSIASSASAQQGRRAAAPACQSAACQVFTAYNFVSKLNVAVDALMTRPGIRNLVSIVPQGPMTPIVHPEYGQVGMLINVLVDLVGREDLHCVLSLEIDQISYRLSRHIAGGTHVEARPTLICPEDAAAQAARSLFVRTVDLRAQELGPLTFRYDNGVMYEN